MSHLSLAIYRLPLPSATQIGKVRVVLDRHQQVYIEGSRVASAVPSGAFLVVTLDNGQVYYVKAAEYERLQATPRRRR
jgi:hypothetical protein